MEVRHYWGQRWSQSPFDSVLVWVVLLGMDYWQKEHSDLTKKGFCSAGDSMGLNCPDLQARLQLDRGMIRESDMCECWLEEAGFPLDL